MNEKSKFPDRQTGQQFVKYVSQEEIKGLIGSLGHALNEKYKDQELVLIGVLKGSLIFLAELAKELKNVKVTIDFVKIDSKGRDKERTGTILLQKDIETDIQDKNVVIIEEVVDTGRALTFLRNRLLLASPKNLEIMTLFDKPHRRTVDLIPHYIGKKIEDQFIVGFGLDIENYGRNLKEVYFLKYPQ